MKTSRFLLCCAAVVSLSGCSGFADALGLGRNSPDEFAVVDRAPLTVPPDFELRPPKPGAPRPQEMTQTAKASQVMFGSNAKVANTPTSGGETYSDAEKSVLEASGGAKTDASIRETIDREAAQRVSGTGHLVDDLLWWKDSSSSTGTVVDAPAEAKRLKEAKEKGDAAAKGATPIIERDKGGFLGL